MHSTTIYLAFIFLVIICLVQNIDSKFTLGIVLGAIACYAYTYHKDKIILILGEEENVSAPDSILLAPPSDDIDVNNYPYAIDDDGMKANANQPPIIDDREEAMMVDEQVASQGTTRNDPKRAIKGSMQRFAKLAPYVTEEMEDNESARWYGQSEN